MQHLSPIRIWGGYTGKIKLTLNGHSDKVYAVAITPNSQTLVSSSKDKTIRVWDLQTGREMYILKPHTAAKTIIISPDGQTLISGHQDSTIKLWNLHTGELISTGKQHRQAVVSLAIHPDGETLASSNIDGVIHIINLTTGEIVQTLNGYSLLAFSRDGKTLLSSSRNGTIKIWQNNENRELLSELSGEWWEVLAVDKDAKPEDVKSAYRRLARLYHPDMNNSARAKIAMQTINQAYQQFQTQTNKCQKS